MCYSFRGASDVQYSRCHKRARVGLSVGISVTVSVPSNKVRVVIITTRTLTMLLVRTIIVLTKSIVKIISLVL